jgi:glycine C-acetyltransferase
LPEPATPLRLLEEHPGVYLLERPLTEVRSENGHVFVEGKGDMILMSSYSYLGLIGHPAIEAAARAAQDAFGTGVHGARLLSGTLPVHRELDARIARFTGHEDAIVFSSGYVANLATISALVGNGDVVFTDVLNHASIQDGCRLSGAETVSFAHNNIEDLGRKIGRADASANKLIVTDTIYSMDGDIAAMPAILGVAARHGALVLVDEAHSDGVIGKTGHGIEEHFGIAPGTIHLKMGTLSKTIPSIGGYVAASREIVQLLRHRARGYIFSSALPAPCAAAALAAFDVIEAEPWRVEKLQVNAKHFRDKLNAAGISTLRSETAVIPALCGDSLAAVDVSRHCFENGVLAMPITYPAVQHHSARLRLTPCANHSMADLDRVVEVLVEAFDKVGIVRCGQAAGRAAP